MTPFGVRQEPAWALVAIRVTWFASASLLLSSDEKRLTQNWYGLKESDCLIKT